MKDQAQKQNGNNNNNSSAPEQLQTLRSDNNNHSTTAEDIIIDKFRKEGFSSLITIKRKELPIISRKINCLLIAPTGSGKTEAAVIPIFSILSSSKLSDVSRGKIQLIYVTPLRSLNNDVLRRIMKYAQSEDLQIQIRHSDTNTITRKRILE